MVQLSTDNESTEKVWNWCKEAFAKNGFNLRFPQSTDRYKTYQWRYASRLAQQFEEWEFDDDTAAAFLDTAVSYIRGKRLLRKGLSAFFQSNMLQICYDRLSELDNLTESRICQISRSHKFVDNRRKGRSIRDTLLACDDSRTRNNVVEWYEVDKVTASYLAISISCTNALAQLSRIDIDQRELLPSTGELFCLCSELSEDSTLKQQALIILGNDWRQSCL
jgi:hypothetical protein